VNQTKPTDAVPSLPSEAIADDETKIMEDTLLLKLRHESKYPPSRAEQPTLRMPRPPRSPQG